MAACSNCSAPLPLSGIICNYCGTRNDIDLKFNKSYRNLRPDLNRTCPLCKIQLKTIDVGEKSSFFIERCDSCYGIFFDLNELDEMIAMTVTKNKKVDLQKLFTITENPRHVDIIVYRNCPVCQKKMHRKNFMSHSGVITDVCFEHGIWLDSGELRHIMEWVKLGGMEKDKTDIPKAFNNSYKPRKRNQKSRELDTEKEEDILDHIIDFLFKAR